MAVSRLQNLLGAAALALHDRLEAAASEVMGLGGEAPAALLTIGTRPGRSVDHLRRTLGLSHSGAVRLADRLQERGWVARRPAPGGREVRLEPTPEGAAVIGRLLAARRDALDAALAPVADADRAPLERALAALLGALPSDREEAWRICRRCDHGVCRGADCPVGSAVDEEG